MSFPTHNCPAAIQVLFRRLGVRQITRSTVIWTVFITMSFAMTACNTASMTTPSPTKDIVTMRMTALLVGELVMTDGCLRVNDVNSGTSYLLVWPPEYTGKVSIEKDTVQIVDRGQTVVWHIGEIVCLGGGGGKSIEHLDERLRPELPLLANCPGPYWVVGSVATSVKITPPFTATPLPTPTPSLSPTPTPRPPTIAEVLAQGEELPFEVCGESTTWIRPSEEEQNAKWWTSGRYKCADERCEQNIKYPWTHDFFVVYGSASIEYDLENLSGLWTLQGEERAGCYERERHEAVLRLEMAEAWVLLHKVKRVKHLGAFYAIVVEPTERGVQFVQFPRPAEKVPLTLYFVTAGGQQIDVIVEAKRPPVAPWPYPRLVPTAGPQH